MHGLPLLCFRAPTSLRWKLLYAFSTPVFMSSAMIFEAAAHRIFLDHLALVARGVCVSRSHKIVTIRETVQSRLPPHGGNTAWTITKV